MFNPRAGYPPGGEPAILPPCNVRGSELQAPADAADRRKKPTVVVYPVGGLPGPNMAMLDQARQGLTKLSEVIVPPRDARCFRVPAGQFFRIVSIDGPQVGDLNLWNVRLVYGIGALLSWIIVVKMGDTGAYAVGRLIGRHKMAPSISPGKTIEGALGALVFACLGSWLTFRWIVPLFAAEGSPAPALWYGWLLFGVLVGGAGILGDLAESLLKRDVGVKDSSTWMPGFGGVLDILDSLLLSAPVAWFCWAFGLVGR